MPPNPVPMFVFQSLRLLSHLWRWTDRSREASLCSEYFLRWLWWKCQRAVQRPHKHLLCISKKEILQVIQERKKWGSSFVQQCGMDMAACTAGWGYTTPSFHLLLAQTHKAMDEEPNGCRKPYLMCNQEFIKPLKSLKQLELPVCGNTAGRCINSVKASPTDAD